ncbi:hypothetical protein MKJ04_13345 [Pontibacter sp. E15-1]|uniref:hypothetical protein n=1 Tax=Pontibacter sp. E15-1 TaxID=2919918 RepID=UPI001F50324D|nr:hypothetical protein [Pontibacter sp. E15-1]MCJ8165831.1 hypothetical protein [Pontibacter sp. E15-1]
MGKRQKRIFRKDIEAHTSELLERQTVQVVLRSRVVMQGHLLHLTAEELQLQDQRFSKHTMPLDDVEEIIYDFEAPY